MYDLILRYFKEEITPEEKQELFSNVHTDEAWKKEFITMQNLYGLTSWLPSDNDNTDSIDKLLSFKQARKKKEQKTLYRHWMGYAAAIIISVVSTWSILYFSFGGAISETAFVETVYEEFTAPPGQRALIKLHDGTTVWLNAQTTLRYPNRFSRTERKVELDGEAFFEVKENPDLPFIVGTEKLSIKVTGTKFNVFAYKGEHAFSTSLTEGSVTLFDPKNDRVRLDLLPNERAVLDGNHLWKEPITDMNFLLWKEGIYAFDNVPFREMVKKLELYYDVTIIIQNPELESYPFNGKFRQRNGIESVLRALMNIKHFTYTKDEENNTITIK